MSIEGLEDETEDQGYGALIALNDDDDNQNQVEDLRELKGPASGEDDLTRVSIDYWLRDDAYAPDFTAHFQFGESIRLWTSEHKDEEILPSVELVLTELPSEVYVEGIDRSTSGLKLVVKAPTSALFTDMVVPAITWLSVGDEDEVRFTVLDIDVDIDSDNEDGFSFPDGSNWEETLEVHPYGLGKLVMLDNPSRLFTPLMLKVTTNLGPHDPSIRVRIDWDNISSGAGRINLWTTHKFNAQRINAPADAGGHRVYPNTEYSLDDLPYDPATGVILLFAEGTAENSLIKTLAGVEQYGKPDERIRGTVVGNGRDLDFDEVKYIVANEDSFFYHLQTRQEVRNELASRGVYIRDDMPEFSLQPLEFPDLSELGVPANIANLLGPNGGGIPGFNAVLYQDFITGEDQYVLTFRGTDDNVWEHEWSDWINNIAQGLGRYAPQYRAALDVGFELRAYPKMIRGYFRGFRPRGFGSGIGVCRSGPGVGA